jgi:hypothetical protein
MVTKTQPTNDFVFAIIQTSRDRSSVNASDRYLQPETYSKPNAQAAEPTTPSAVLVAQITIVPTGSKR